MTIVPWTKLVKIKNVLIPVLLPLAEEEQNAELTTINPVASVLLAFKEILSSVAQKLDAEATMTALIGRDVITQFNLVYHYVKEDHAHLKQFVKPRIIEKIVAVLILSKVMEFLSAQPRLKRSLNRNVEWIKTVLVNSTVFEKDVKTHAKFQIHAVVTKSAQYQIISWHVLALID